MFWTIKIINNRKNKNDGYLDNFINFAWSQNEKHFETKQNVTKIPADN